MKPKLILSFITLIVSLSASAQETVAVTSELTSNVTLRYNVLRSNSKIKDGLYQAFYKKKTTIASGKYANGKRAGMWHFYNKAGKLIQNFDYASYNLTYEAPEDSASNFKYVLDEKFTDKDTITKPIRVGGRYFGYLPYLNLFRLPKEMIDPTQQWPSVYMELLVSPGGRLADYRVHIVSTLYGERVLRVDINQLNDEDKLFAPASINKRNVSSRIIVLCTLNGSRRLEI